MDTDQPSQQPKVDKRAQKKKTNNSSSSKHRNRSVKNHYNHIPQDSPSIIYEDLPYGNSKEYEEAREKEAIAVNYLRDLSEEDTKDLISHNPTKRLDNDLNAIETSEKLAPFLDHYKKPASSAVRTRHSIGGSQNTYPNKTLRENQLIQIQKRNKSDIKLTNRISSEPNIYANRIRNIVKLKHYGLCNNNWDDDIHLKRNIELEFSLEDNRNHEAYKEGLNVTAGTYNRENTTEVDYHELKLDGNNTLEASNSIKPGTILQLGKIEDFNLRNSHEEKDHQNLKTIQTYRTLYNEIINNPFPIKAMIKNLSSSKGIGLEGLKASVKVGPSSISLVGRSFSMPKMSLRIENKEKYEYDRSLVEELEGETPESEDRNSASRENKLRRRRNGAAQRSSHVINRVKLAEKYKLKLNEPELQDAIDESSTISNSGPYEITKNISGYQNAEENKARVHIGGNKKITKLGLVNQDINPQVAIDNHVMINPSKENKMYASRVSMPNKLKLPTFVRKKKKEGIDPTLLLEVSESSRMRKKFKDIMSIKHRENKSLPKNESLRDLFAKAGIQSFEGKIPPFKDHLKSPDRNIEELKRLSMIIKEPHQGFSKENRGFNQLKKPFDCSLYPLRSRANTKKPKGEDYC